MIPSSARRYPRPGRERYRCVGHQPQPTEWLVMAPSAPSRVGVRSQPRMRENRKTNSSDCRHQQTLWHSDCVRMTAKLFPKHPPAEVCAMPQKQSQLAEAVSSLAEAVMVDLPLLAAGSLFDRSLGADLKQRAW